MIRIKKVIQVSMSFDYIELARPETLILLKFVNSSLSYSFIRFVAQKLYC